MGLKLGKARLHDAVVPFCKISKASVMKLITTYQNLSDGFGVSMNELSEIMAELYDELQIAPEMVKLISTHLFKLLDTDENGLVDGLELLSTLAFCSGMKKTEMVEFSLTLYDFNNAAALSFDELVLAMKSACSGMCKVHDPLYPDFSPEKMIMPSDEKLEQVASIAFTSSGTDTAAVASDSQSKTNDVALSLLQKNIKELTDELLCIPEVCSWLGYFCNFTEIRDIPLYTDFEAKDVVVQRLSHLERTDGEVSVVNWDVHYSSNPPDPYRNAQWRDQVAVLAPLMYANGANLSKKVPDIKVSANWIYGYEAEHGRKNTFYTFSNDIVYSSGKFAIVFLIKTNEQRIFTGHVEEVTCMIMHPNLKYIATGEDGKDPSVIVWNTETLEVLHKSSGNYHHGISQLSFSPAKGDLLLIVDNADVKSVTLLHWQTNTVIYKDLIDAKLITSAVILPKDTFAICGDCHVYFWNKYTEGFYRREGLFLKNKAKEVVTCMISSKNNDGMVSGTISGKLLLWNGINCTRQVRAHSGCINALHFCQDGFLSAGKDSRIRMWSSTMEPKFLFDVSKFGVSTSVLSVSLSRDATSILFSISDADIFEISAIDGSDLRGGPIVKSHAYGNINCADTHPSKFEFVTIGADRTVRVIDMTTKSLLRMAKLDTEGRTVAYSPIGDVIAIGTDNSTTNGCMFVILNEENLSILHSARDTRRPVTVIKFSPEGETLAVGTQDGSIFLYSVHDDYELVAKCTKHTAAITSMDFSLEGEWLRSNSINGEFHFFNVDDGGYQSNVPAMRDVVWASQECLFSWHTKGIHTLEHPLELLTCCTVPRTDKKTYLACGSTLGQVRVYYYPAAIDGAEAFRFQAHSQAVADVRFAFDGSIMITVGKYDRSVIQWKVNKNIESIETASEGDNNENLQEIEFELAVREQVIEFYPERPVETSIGLLNDANQNQDQEKFRWIANIVDPSTVVPINNDIPNLPVRLHHIYGYETTTLRNNLTFLSNNEIAYTCASYGIVWNNANTSQRAYKAHTNKITAFASTLNGEYIATGELGRKARVVIWSPKTLQTLFIAPEDQAYSVCCLAFSDNGRYLAIVGNDRYHTVSIYDWKQNALVSKFYAGEAKVLGILFYTALVTGEGSAAGAIGESDLEIMTVGCKHIKFWKSPLSKFPVCVAPNFAEIGRTQTFLTCISYLQYQAVGTADGNLYVFQNCALKQVVKAHLGGIFSLGKAANNHPILLTGGQDGSVRQWDGTFECVKEFNIESLTKNHVHSVRAIAVHPDNSTMVIGTQGGELLEIVLRDGVVKQNGIAIRGHNTQLWGVAIHPKNDVFATTGDDALLRIWDMKTRTTTKTIKLELGSRAVTFSPDGTLIALGFGSGRRVKGKLPAKEGAIMVIAFETMRTIFEGKDSALAITAMQFSPDGKLLAVGSEDHCIYTYNVTDQYSLRYTVKSHQAPIRSIDFSINNFFMMSCDIAERTFYTMCTTGLSTASGDDTKDEKWLYYNNPLSWATQGLWLTQPQGQHLVGSCKSHNSLFLVTVNAIGDLMLSRFPTPKRAGFQLLGKHCGRVNGLHWSMDDSMFITLGVDDCMILQWQVIPAIPDPQPIDLHPVIPHEVSQLFNNELCVINKTLSVFNKNSIDSAINSVQDRTTFQWSSMISEPSKKIPDLAELPFTKIHTKYVHGNQRSSHQPCLFYNNDGDIVYCTSNYGIVYDRNTYTQKYYTQHTKEISAITISYSRKIVATGDCQDLPELHLWDSMVCNKIIIFKQFTRNSIVALSFSSTGNYLIAVGNDSLHSVSLFCSPTGHWWDGYYVTSASVTPHPITWCLYADYRDFSVLVGGEDGILHMFRPLNGSLVAAKMKVEHVAKHQALLCAVETTFSDRNAMVDVPAVLVGTSDGLLYAVGPQNATLHRISAHYGELHAMVVAHQTVINRAATAFTPMGATCSGHKILTLGGDGNLKIWTSALTAVATLNVEKYIVTSSLSGLAKTMAYSPERTSVTLGWDQGDIWEFSIGSQSPILLCEGHTGFNTELHGLAWNPTSSEEYVTVGDDGIVKVWHFSAKYVLRRKNIKFASRAIAWSPNGTLIAMGIGVPDRERSTPKDGAVILLDAASLGTLREEKKSKKYITDIQFSPNGEHIAMSSGDGKVYIVDLSLVSVKLVDVAAKRPALRLDYSNDMTMMRIAFQPDRIAYYNLQNGEVEVNPVTVKDVQWATNSCPFSWNTQGIFYMYPEKKDETVDPTVTPVSADQQILVTTDALAVTAITVNLVRKLLFVAFENGEIRVYGYPFIDPMSKVYFVITKLASYASRLSCNSEGTYLVAIESRSRSVFEFQIPHVSEDKFKSMLVLEKKSSTSGLPPPPMRF